MDCQLATNQHNRCKVLCLQFPHCACEQHSVSSYSPGIVQDDEYLVRLIFSPTHFNEQTGKLKPFAFLDCKDKGLSVNRLQYTSVDELKQTAAFISCGRQIVGVVVAQCADIRAIVDEENQRAFCVYDTATKNNQSHADICQAVADTCTKTGKGRKRGSQLRRKLMKIFSEHPLTLEEAFSKFT
ncbi:MAG: hypothetical protein ABFS56_16770 [Pseudomonadota bacterium]